MLVWWGCLCLVEYGTVEWQRGQINVTMMPTELLRSARFSFAAFPSSKRSWCPLTLLCFRGLYQRADRRISPQYYLMFLLSLLSVAYTQFTYWLVSVVLNTTTLSGLWREGLFCEHVKSQLQVTNIYRHCDFGLKHSISASLGKWMSFQISGYCMWQTLSPSLTHTRTYNLVCVYVLVCWEIAINASQFSRTALKPQPVFWCKRQHFQSLSNLSSIIVHLPGWYENNEELCVFIS